MKWPRPLIAPLVPLLKPLRHTNIAPHDGGNMVDGDANLHPCRRAPFGWYCVRSAAHQGPCPAYPKFVYHPILWYRSLQR